MSPTLGNAPVMGQPLTRSAEVATSDGIVGVQGALKCRPNDQVLTPKRAHISSAVQSPAN